MGPRTAEVVIVSLGVGISVAVATGLLCWTTGVSENATVTALAGVCAGAICAVIKRLFCQR